MSQICHEMSVYISLGKHVKNLFKECNPQNTKHDPPKRKYQTWTNLPKAIKRIMLHFMDPPRGTRTATKGRLAPVMGTSECWRTCQNHLVEIVENDS